MLIKEKPVAFFVVVGFVCLGVFLVGLLPFFFFPNCFFALLVVLLGAKCPLIIRSLWYSFPMYMQLPSAQCIMKDTFAIKENKSSPQMVSEEFIWDMEDISHCYMAPTVKIHHLTLIGILFQSCSWCHYML